MSSPRPSTVSLLGVGVHALDLPAAREGLLAAWRGGARGYVCFADVNSLCWAARDPLHRLALEKALLVAPDGMPVVWLARRRAPESRVGRVYGPDVLLALAAATAGTGAGHFFCGGAPGVAERLGAELARRFPGLRVAGSWSPPFRDLAAEEVAVLARQIHASRTDFLWIGLGTPKQERFLLRHFEALGAPLALGVGAAFDFFTGRVRQAPRFVRHAGGEWLWRIAMEPRRLTGRYARNLPRFLWALATETRRR